MTQLEQELMETTISTLRRIAEALEGINEKMELLTQRQDQPAPASEPAPDRKDDYSFHPIEMVLKELERIDIDDMIERRKENPRAVPVGYATRAGNCCKENDIKTVGNLLDFGYKRFCNQRHVNKGTAGCVTQALQNLYGITEW